MGGFDGYRKMRWQYRYKHDIVRFLTALVARVTWDGREHIPAEGGCLIVANHASFADPTTVGLAVGREMYFLARQTLFRPPVMDKLLPTCNCLPIDRDHADLKGMRGVIHKLKDGRIVLLFPEGTRSVDGRLQPAEAGAGFIACKAQKPIVPARLFGTFETYSRHHKYPQFGGRWHVSLGKPFLPPPGPKFTKGDYAALADRMMAEIAQLEKPSAPPT
jgi:1-acyl-sn-glycerol-3-phosphate acyltransferase